MRRSRPIFRALLVASALTAFSLPASTPASGQTVAGTVTERDTARPVPGTFVVLLDESGARRNGVLTGADGGYILRVSAPGRYRLLAEMIGYASTTSEWLDVAPGATVRLDLAVPVEAVRLDAIQVETGQRCRRRPGSGEETARLWEEARKALEVARWSQAQNILRFHVVRHERELDARSLRVLAQQEQATTGYYDSSPYKSVSIERLERAGYVQKTEPDIWNYFAPDADVLLSEAFLDDHCFRVQGPPAGEPDLIGLGFEPVPERRLPDISGVLWLDRGSAELRRLDFTYVALPFRPGRWAQVGGRVEFERLATGTWIVRRWYIRMPLEARETGGFGGGGRDMVLVTLSEAGGEVRSVTTRSGAPIAEALGATLYGTLTGSEGGLGPGLAGARVEVLATDAATSTADDGAFRLTGLPAGTFDVRITHPELVRIGIGPVESTVELEPGRATRLAVGVNLTSARARELCEEGGWAAPGRGVDPALIYGDVIGPDGRTPIPGAVVRVWSDGPEWRTVADEDGGFRFCVEPAAAPIRLAAVGPDAVLVSPSLLDVVEVDATRPGFIRARVPFSNPPEPTAVPGSAASTRLRNQPGANGSAWSNAILGRVLEEGTDQPVEGALVTLTSPEGSPAGSMVTDGRGRFKLLHPSSRGDRFSLKVEHIAYGTVESEVRFPPREELRLGVLVSTRAVPLDPIVVTERRHDFLADQGFYERMERGAGTFIQREEIERRRPTEITDVLQGRAGVRVVSRGSEYDLRMTDLIGFGATDCRPSIFVDGAMVRGGGAMSGVVGIPDSVELVLSEVISPDDVEAIELYTGPGDVPQQFGGTTSPCGAVIIWNRRGVSPAS